MSFEQATRFYQIPQPAQSKPTGGGTISWVLPRAGLLARIWVTVTGSVAGTLSNPNALGMASIINRIRLIAQGGQDIVNVSGAGFHYLLRPYLDLAVGDSLPSASPFAAVTATTFDLSFVLPVAVNMRSSAGLIALQNDETALTLSIDFTADASVATGATVTATAKPTLDLFTVPANPADFPREGVAQLHQILEDQFSVAGAVDFVYEWQRSNGQAVRTIHGAGFAQSGSDAWSRFQVKANESNVILDHDVATHTLWHWFLHRATRRVGTFAWDGMASSGLGNYGLYRDYLDPKNVSRITSVITTTGATTVYTIRETLLNIAPKVAKATAAATMAK